MIDFINERMYGNSQTRDHMHTQILIHGLTFGDQYVLVPKNVAFLPIFSLNYVETGEFCW